MAFQCEDIICVSPVVISKGMDLMQIQPSKFPRRVGMCSSKRGQRADAVNMTTTCTCIILQHVHVSIRHVVFHMA